MATTIKELLQELEQEAPTTRRVLERVPTDRLAWRPHAKSMSLGELATHIARLPGPISEMARAGSFDAASIPPTTSAANTDEILAIFDASLAHARDTISAVNDADLAGPWRMVRGDQELMSMPRGAVFRSILFNHWYHHRGQLTVYLRLNDVPLPSVYGPSADERPFG
ncbi:MAG TPA: DinB family protein [Gemmatimonadales bacterium]|nr:DinB family protein [Gemmatimonadales bacterium]